MVKAIGAKNRTATTSTKHGGRQTQMKKLDKPRVVTHTEPFESVFIFGDSVQNEIHVILREDDGEYSVEVQGGGPIIVHPRASNVIRVQLERLV